MKTENLSTEHKRENRKKEAKKKHGKQQPQNKIVGLSLTTSNSNDTI